MDGLGQRVMRSPYQHHLAPSSELQMLDFARLHRRQLTAIERDQLALGASGRRAIVPRDVFTAHSAHVVAAHRLREFAYHFPVAAVGARGDGRWHILGQDGQAVTARVVVVATGSRHAPWPDPLPVARPEIAARVTSAFAGPGHLEPEEPVVVVGSGLTAAHAILQVVSAGAHPIWLVRREEHYRELDFSPSYFQEDGIRLFQKMLLSKRCRCLREAFRGSIMPEFATLLRTLEQRCMIDIHRFVHIDHMHLHSDNQIRIYLSSGRDVLASRIILATGLAPSARALPAGIRLVDDIYPLLHDQTLEVVDAPNVFAAGVLASLSLGPAARNVGGARLAAERIVPTIAERVAEAAGRRTR
jgi:cation diffusion facilitator CzcD-associated flavoprotein CzcO